MTPTGTSRLLTAGIAAAAVVDGFMLAGGSVPAARAAMSSGEISTIHAGLFIAAVWTVSGLRIDRLRAFWRVGFRSKAMRASGSMLSRGPDARAAAGGSASGAGVSGQA